MNIKSAIGILITAMAFHAFAAVQWEPEDFVGLVSEGRATVDASIAGSSTIVIFSNTVGMKGSNPQSAPDEGLLMIVTRDVPGSRIPYQSIHAVMRDSKEVAPGISVIDIADGGEVFQEGDTVEFLSWDWDDDFTMDALTPGMTSPQLANDNTPAFNPDFGVDSYFESYANGDLYDGSIAWTFGEAVAAGGSADSEVPVSGQPLPGVVATMLIGFAAMKATRGRHKKNA